MSDGTRLREEFLLDPNVTFLNHGSFGATPRAVFERYQEWQLELERQPVLAGSMSRSPRPARRSALYNDGADLERLRDALAALL